MAFCKNCGTQIADDATFCGNCGTAVNAAPAPQAAPVQPVYQAAPIVVAAPQQPVGNGLSGAITACVLGALSLIFIILAGVFVEEAALYNWYFYVADEYYIYIALAYVFFIASLPVAIVGIVKGAKSIGAFGAYKRQTGKPFVATLICGIAGLVLSCIGLLYAIIIPKAVVSTNSCDKLPWLNRKIPSQSPSYTNAPISAADLIWRSSASSS